MALLLLFLYLGIETGLFLQNRGYLSRPTVTGCEIIDFFSRNNEEFIIYQIDPSTKLVCFLKNAK